MKAVVLCAGYGTRLGDLTRDLPKPMLDVGGVPLLERTLRHLAGQGISEAAINLHFLPEAIPRHFGDGTVFGLRLRYFHETSPLGTAGALRQMAGFLDESFLVHYGDILTDQSLAPLLDVHRLKRTTCTLLLHRRARSNSVARLEGDGTVSAFWERPKDSPAVSDPWVFSGLCVCEPRLLAEIPDGAVADLPRDLFPLLATAGQLAGVPLSGTRVAIDSPERLEEARRLVAVGTHLAPRGGGA